MGIILELHYVNKQIIIMRVLRSITSNNMLMTQQAKCYSNISSSFNFHTLKAQCAYNTIIPEAPAFKQLTILTLYTKNKMVIILELHYVNK